MEFNEVQKEAESAGRKAIAFGLGALLLAGLFGWMLAHLASGGPETRPVVVATQQIAPLSQPKIDELRVVQWPVASLPPGTFERPEDVIKTGEININGLVEGEPVLQGRLSTPDKGLGMSQMVEAGKRAFVVQVQDSVATAQILHPGATVDVLATLQDTKTHETVTKLLLQNVSVVAVGDSIDVERTDVDHKDESAGRSKVERHRVVTLMVNTADLELIAFASRYGQIDLTLRNNNDTATVTSQGVTMDRVMGRKRGDEPKRGDAAAGAAAGSLSDGVDAAAAAPAARSGGHSGHSGRSSGAHGPSIIKINR